MYFAVCLYNAIHCQCIALFFYDLDFTPVLINAPVLRPTLE